MSHGRCVGSLRLHAVDLILSGEMYEHDRGYDHIYQHSDNVVGDGYERAGGQSGTTLNFSRVRGTKVPNTDAKITTDISDSDTASVVE